MNATTTIRRARELGVSLRADGDKIKAKGPRSAVEQILPHLKQYKPELLAVLGQPRPDADEFGTDWLLIDAGQVFRFPFKTAKTRGELVQRYPDCLVLRLPDATQSRELTALVARIAVQASFTHEEIYEALERALCDPKAALKCFRALARDAAGSATSG
jgi:hypothetical protein